MSQSGLILFHGAYLSLYLKNYLNCYELILLWVFFFYRFCVHLFAVPYLTLFYMFYLSVMVVNTQCFLGLFVVVAG